MNTPTVLENLICVHFLLIRGIPFYIRLLARIHYTLKIKLQLTEICQISFKNLKNIIFEIKHLVVIVNDSSQPELKYFVSFLISYEIFIKLDELPELLNKQTDKRTGKRY